MEGIAVLVCVSLGKKAIWGGFAKWVHGFGCIGSGFGGLCRAVVGLLGVGRHEECQEGARALPEGWRSRGGGRWMWLKSVRAGESGNGAEVEKTASKCTLSALEGSGWPGVHEGTGSKCGGAVEWTGGELKVAK